MFIIGEAVVETAVAEVSFSCDVEKCRGACCFLEGGRGAPLEDDEILEIEKAYPSVKEYLSRKSLSTIESSGMYEGVRGDFATTCINDRECVFAYFEDGIARCSFERAFREQKTDWRKPLSCHLFPIRIRSFGRDMVRYEEIDECHPGRVRGHEQEVPLREFLREPLVRKYGEEWYEEFIAYCRTRFNAPAGK
jgi:hypothetical protein